MCLAVEDVLGKLPRTVSGRSGADERGARRGVWSRAGDSAVLHTGGLGLCTHMGEAASSLPSRWMRVRATGCLLKMNRIIASFCVSQMDALLCETTLI